MSRLIAEARRLGVPPEDYAKQLVEDGLAIRREARTTTFAKIMAPVRASSGAISDVEILKLVDKARRKSTHREKR